MTRASNAAATNDGRGAGGRRRGRITFILCVLMMLTTATVTVAARGTAPRHLRATFDYCADRTAVATVRNSYLGIGDSFVESGSEHFRDCSFGRMAADHINYFRGVLNWAAVENIPGRYSFVYYDTLIADLARHHLRLLPVLDGAPGWASTAPATGAAAGLYPPARVAQFARFAALCVERYGPRGTFWSENPGLPYSPIKAWEVWNEPNLSVDWEPNPNAAAYARLLRASDEAIKRADPHATVVTAGMPFADGQLETKFLSRMFRSGAQGHFDALALHPYAGTVALAIHKLQVARALMNRSGAGRVPLWVTEVSWAGGGRDAYIANQRGQERNLVQFVQQTIADHALRVKRVFWYGWQDKIYGPDPSYWGYHLGLLTANLRPKLALGALTTIAARLDR